MPGLLQELFLGLKIQVLHLCSGKHMLKCMEQECMEQECMEQGFLPCGSVLEAFCSHDTSALGESLPGGAGTVSTLSWMVYVYSLFCGAVKVHVQLLFQCVVLSNILLLQGEVVCMCFCVEYSKLNTI